MNEGLCVLDLIKAGPNVFIETMGDHVDVSTFDYSLLNFDIIFVFDRQEIGFENVEGPMLTVKNVFDRVDNSSHNSNHIGGT